MRSVPSRYTFGKCALPLFIALLAGTFTVPLLAAPPVENIQCILGQPDAPTGLNCTANDVSLSSPIVTVVDPCSFPGDTATLQVLVDVTLSAQTRYDVGVWVSVDGDPNGDGSESGICTALSIPSDIFNADGESVDLDTDQCGDVDDAEALGADILDADLGTFTLQCLDTDGDGLINVPLIISWNNQPDISQTNPDCDTSVETIPGTAAKCFSNPDANLPVPVPARLIVNKSTTGDDPTSFEFTLAGPTPAEPAPDGWDGTDEVFNLADGDQFDSAVTFVNGGLPAGDDYSVTETAEDGWLSQGVCSSDVDGGNTDPANLDLRAGETVTCDFTNTPDTGTLTVVKQSQGASGEVFNFNGTSSIGAFALDTTADNPDSEQFVLEPGSYDVTETIPDGWVLNSASCTDDNGTPNLQTGAITGIEITGGSAVTCTFVNAQEGTVTVTKIALGGDDTFGFVSDIPAEGADDFNITTVGGTGTVGGGFQLVAGDYTLTEDTIPAGWQFVSAECRDQADAVVSTPNGDGADFTSEEGDTVSCTVTNEALGTIIVEKQTLPNGATGSFTFAGDAAGSISDGGVITVADLDPGTYTATETVPEGWDLTSIVCDDDDSTGTVGTATATFEVEAGETVTCTFTNTQRGSITVVKALQGDPGDLSTVFDFTSTFSGAFQLDPVGGDPSLTTSNLETGTYSVTEAASAGWQRYSATCGGTGEVVNLATGVISNIDLDAGEDITCTFTNRPIPPTVPFIPVPVNQPLALILMTLMLLGAGWYFRPARLRRKMM